MVRLSSHIEDYLETIIMLDKEKRIVRVRDISGRMRVSMPSVCAAIKVLTEKGLVDHEKYGYVELTEQGRTLGEKIYDSHRILVRFLKEILNTNVRSAEREACRIEHGISRNTIKKLVAFVKFVENYPYPEGADWLGSFDYFCKYGRVLEKDKSKKVKT